MMRGNSLSRARESSGAAAPRAFMLWLAVATACARAAPSDGLEPLEGVYARAAALVTTSVRGRLREQPDGHRALLARLPLLERQSSSDSLLAELRAAVVLRGLAEPIERDITFEIEKPEHEEIRANVGSAEVQRQLVVAIVAGMRRALAQLERDSR